MIDVPEFDLLLPDIGFTSLFDSEPSSGTAPAARPSSGSRQRAGSGDLGAAVSPSALSTRAADDSGSSSAVAVAAPAASHSGAEDDRALGSHRDAPPSSHERGSSTSSCSSSLRSPWPVGSSVKGLGSGNSSGPPTQRSPDRSMTPSMQGEELSSGSHGSVGQATVRRVGELEIRNRDLEARVAGLMQELSQLRGSTMTSSVPAASPPAARPSAQDVASSLAASASTAEGGAVEEPAGGSVDRSSEGGEGHNNPGGERPAKDETLQGADRV